MNEDLDEEREWKEREEDEDPYLREERMEQLREESEELSAENRRELREIALNELANAVGDSGDAWALEFRVAGNAIDLFDGERRVATVYDPMDAQRLLGIIRRSGPIARIAKESLGIVGDLNKYLFDSKANNAVRFITDANYVRGGLKEQNQRYKEKLDKSESKA